MAIAHLVTAPDWEQLGHRAQHVMKIAYKYYDNSVSAIISVKRAALAALY